MNGRSVAATSVLGQWADAKSALAGKEDEMTLRLGWHGRYFEDFAIGGI